jgi:outer membrane receptor protein involved in Fe transport
VYFSSFAAPGAGYDPATMRIRRWTYLPARNDEEREIVPRFDLTKTFSVLDASSFELQGGFYGRLRSKESEIEQIRRNQNAGSNLVYSDLGNSQVVSDFDKKGIFWGPMPDYNTALNFVQNHESAFGPLQLLSPAGYATDPSDFAADEDIYAGYLMGTFKRDRITVIAGVRYEKTEEEFQRFTAGTGLITTADEYDHVLPSVHLRYTLAKDLFLRASWSNTVARPNPESIYGNQVIDRTARTINIPSSIARREPSIYPTPVYSRWSRAISMSQSTGISGRWANSWRGTSRRTWIISRSRSRRR